MGVQSLMQSGFVENWKGRGRGFKNDIIVSIDDDADDINDTDTDADVDYGENGDELVMTTASVRCSIYLPAAA